MKPVRKSNFRSRISVQQWLPFFTYIAMIISIYNLDVINNVFAWKHSSPIVESILFHLYYVVLICYACAAAPTHARCDQCTAATAERSATSTLAKSNSFAQRFDHQRALPFFLFPLNPFFSIYHGGITARPRNFSRCYADCAQDSFRKP